MNIVSRHHPLKHYKWGIQCDGWNLVEEAMLSVKMEQMPAGTEESLHFHNEAQQFFFILEGQAVFEVEGDSIIVKEEEGIHIKAGERHKIMNQSKALLRFLLCSQPSTKNDRHNLA